MEDGFGENDENCSSPYRKKMVATQSKSSPTAEGKKILGERNGNSVISDAQNCEMIDFNEKKGCVDPIICPSKNCISEPCDKMNAVVSNDPLSRLSPRRPKYLRFNPNRRAEILSRLGSEEVNLNRIIGCKEVSDEVELKIGENGEEVNEIINEEDDEEEEPKRERGWCIRGVLKHMFMLIACLFFMSYICPMNTPLPAKQAPWNSTDGYIMVQKQSLDFMSISMNMKDVDFLGGSVDGAIVGAEFYEGYGIDSDEMVEANEELLEWLDETVANLTVDEGLSEPTVAERVEGNDADGGNGLAWEELPVFSEKLITVESNDVDAENGLVENVEAGDFEVEEIWEELPETAETSSDSRDEYREMQKLRLSILAMVGAFAGSSLLAATGFLYRAKNKSRKSKLSTKKKKKVAMAATMPQSDTMEKKVEFLARPSLLHSAMEAPAELIHHHLRAPTVELIGEIVVGERRSHGSSTTFRRTEFSPTSLQQSQPILTPNQTSTIEHSMHRRRKEGSTPTPLRRSNRLRSRGSAAAASSSSP
ncbi:uncharacterized protein LOC127263091 isoform X2 [Andrographis paniculata]|uniref:uncharacterized protein LOC127263091 isoform X2 n=1 Tax=Andrographis paniculata TaxID=175694 RepID=UPI0021E911A2|nr:uncharacterized protein LOC127263091 isoform X2 [Andrographis paniculata]